MEKISQLALLLKQKSLIIAVAESCTGGNLSAYLTKKSGASAYFYAGFITYSNQAKIATLGVKKHTLDKFGAVSQEVAIEMVRGVVKNTSADVAVATTGIAGPGGGTKEKPVGMVCFGFSVLGQFSTTTQYFSGSRERVIQASIDFVIATLVEQLFHNEINQ